MLDTLNESTSSRRQAEESARNHRLDLDRVIYAALNRLQATAIHESGTDTQRQNGWLTAYVSPDTTHDVLALIDEIRASLSPVVRRLG